MEYLLLIALLALVVVVWFARKRPQQAQKGAAARTPEARAPQATRTEETPRSSILPPKPVAPAEPNSAEAPQAKPAPAPEPALAPVAAPTSRREPTLRPPPSLLVLRQGLKRSRDEGGFFGRLRALVSGRRELDEALAQQIEELLLGSDVGAAATQKLLGRLRENLAHAPSADPSAVWTALKAEACRMLSVEGAASDLNLSSRPAVVLFVGVNGAGKTTTIGKLAARLTSEGRTCVLAAGDTFRAAAVQQLLIWGKRVGCEVVHGKDGADPGSVLFEASRRAKETGAEVILADTAGRLHTKTNLMVEMQKIARSASKAVDGAPHEVLLVIDATNGQNALAQAREFKQSLGLTGIVLTKLDGTAKGGVVLGIADTLGLPVRFIGMGEGPEDLHPFAAERFIDALLGDEPAA